MEAKRKELKRSRTLFVQMAIDNYLLYLDSEKENYQKVAEPALKYTAEQYQELQTLYNEIELIKGLLCKKLGVKPEELEEYNAKM